MQKVNVYVVIVTFNAMPWIASCLNSLRCSTLPVSTIIIDNGSTDGTVEYLRNNYLDANIIISKHNYGFGKANNIGIRKAYDEGAEYIYLLNQDAWIMPNTIKDLVNVMSNNKEIGVVSPMQLDATMKNVDKLFLKDIMLGDSTAKEMISDYIIGELKDYYTLPYFPAAHWLLSRSCIETVGLFSPAFFHYGEDNNYLHRVQYHGFKSAVVPKVLAIHDRGQRKKLDLLGIIFFQYNNAIIQASNIKNNAMSHLLYMIKYSVISVLYFLFTRCINFVNGLKYYYLKMTPYNVVRKCYRLSKVKGFMLDSNYE